MERTKECEYAVKNAHTGVRETSNVTKQQSNVTVMLLQWHPPRPVLIDIMQEN